MTAKGDSVLVAVIGAPHGVRGELRVKTHTQDPMALATFGSLRDDAGNLYEVTSIRPAGNVVVVRLSGIDSREAAEALKGRSLHIARALLSYDTLEDDEFFQTDLVGLVARDGKGRTYGTVRSVHNFGGGDILELAGGGKRAVMIPFTEAAVPEIDVAAGFILVDPVAAGLDDDAGDGAGKGP